MIRNALERIARDYLSAKGDTFAKHDLAHFVRHGGPDEVKTAAANLGSLAFKGGCGNAGNWADVPWFGVFDPAVTTKAGSGHYLVYLFSTDMSRAYLSLNQGTTEVAEEHGNTKAALDELRARAIRLRERVPEYRQRYSDVSIDLVSKNYFPRGYEAGHAFGAIYDLSQLPVEERLVDDLADLTRLYRIATVRGGVQEITQADIAEAGLEKATLKEKRRYVAHRSLERNPQSAKAAKDFHGYTCQGCCFDFEAVYGERGKGYIEAHHLIPLSTLPEGRGIEMDPEHDFAVLCANCHRIVHRTKTLLSLEDLRQLPGVEALRKMAGPGGP